MLFFFSREIFTRMNTILLRSLPIFYMQQATSGVEYNCARYFWAPSPFISLLIVAANHWLLAREIVTHVLYISSRPQRETTVISNDAHHIIMLTKDKGITQLLLLFSTTISISHNCSTQALHYRQRK